MTGKKRYTTIVVCEMIYMWYFGNGKIVVPLQRQNQEYSINSQNRRL